ncbi:MAG: type IV pilus modification protein PilV [Gammaproteobacteria bacterium]|nr:type IV pilus modification protein PilV [Gammaproteobacteria bacterium]
MNARHLRRGQSGLSLVEILVTTVVFSIGLLGVTGLNAISQRASFEAVQRSVASELAYALLEDLRGNSDALVDYLAAGDLGRGSRGAEPAPTCDDPVAPCTAQQLAIHGLWEWEQALDGALETAAGVATGGLLAPTACIGGPVAGDAGVYSVTIVWRAGSELTDLALNNCGAGTGLYGAGNTFRRMVVIQSYIDPAI